MLRVVNWSRWVWGPLCLVWIARSSIYRSVRPFLYLRAGRSKINTVWLFLQMRGRNWLLMLATVLDRYNHSSAGEVIDQGRVDSIVLQGWLE